MVEPAVGIEPTTDSLQNCRSAAELSRPIKWYPGRDSNPQVITTTDFKSVSVAHFDTRADWSGKRDLNSRPIAPKAIALARLRHSRTLFKLQTTLVVVAGLEPATSSV